MKLIKANRAGARWRRVPVLAGLIAALLIASAVGGWAAAWSTVDVQIAGTLRTSMLDDEATAQTWARMHPESPKNVPSGSKVLAEVTWTDQQQVHWPATECGFVVLLVHGRESGSIGFIGDGFSQGSSGTVDQALRRYPDIPTEVNSVGSTEFAGTAFTIGAKRQRPPLTVLLNWPAATPLLTVIRAGIVFACNDRLIDFKWLETS